MRRLTFVERRDQRLDDRRRAVVSARVAPRLQVMRFGNMPVTKLRCLVMKQAEVDARLDLRHPLGEFQVGGRVVYRVAAGDHQQIDLTGVYVARQFAERLRLINRVGIDRRDVDDRCARIAERLIHPVYERVNGGRLRIARDDQASAAMPLEIARERLNPIPPLRFNTARPPSGLPSSLYAEPGGDISREARDLARPHWEAV